MSAVASTPRITPFLWFESRAEEAVDFYLSIFKSARKLGELRASVDTPSVPKGGVLTIDFELEGQRFTALNGGAFVKFNESISFFITCSSQAEIDEYWAKLTANGGSEVQCGWLKDKFGLSWQIVPQQIFDLIKHPKAMEAMMQMVKLDIAALEEAAKL